MIYHINIIPTFYNSWYIYNHLYQVPYPTISRISWLLVGYDMVSRNISWYIMWYIWYIMWYIYIYIYECIVIYRDTIHPELWYLLSDDRSSATGDSRLDNRWTSAASERPFSVAGNTITEKHSRLTDKNSENIIFLHSNQPMWYTWQQYCLAVVELYVVWLVFRLWSGNIFCFATGPFSSFGSAPGSDGIAVSTSCFSSHFLVELFSFLSKWCRFVCGRD